MTDDTPREGRKRVVSSSSRVSKLKEKIMLPNLEEMECDAIIEN